MDLQIYPDYDTLSDAAAEWVLRTVRTILRQKDFCVMCPSAGGTPVGLYQRLAESYTEQLDVDKLLIVQMDEYAGLDDSPQLYRHFLNQHVLQPLGIKNSILFQRTDDAGIRQYAEGLKLFGGVDVFIHGIGENGHLGFNEPGSSFESTVRRVELAESTRRANARFFNSLQEAPKSGVTLGLADIKSGRQQLVLACGERKAKALWHLVHGAPSTQWPATCLQGHKAVTVMADKAAATKLYRLG